MGKKRKLQANEAPLDEHFLAACLGEYLSDIVPDDAGTNQVTETSHAFMAGAAVMMNGFRRSPEELNDEHEFEKFMSDVINEIQIYADEIRA